MATKDKNCPFCSILEKKISALTIYEDSHALAFLDIAPKAPGHTMVIPRVHAKSLSDLQEDIVGPLFSAVKKVTNLLILSLNADGLNIGINQGRASGQVVDHLHVHLFPRFENDGGGSVHSIVENVPEETLEQIYRKIMNFAA